MNNWEIVILPTAKRHLKAILDQRVQRSINDCIERLKEEPDKRGKPLTDSLAGYRSIRAYRQRYRVVYEIDTEQKKVLIHIVGIRKEGDKSDVYALAKKILRLGLLTLTLLTFAFFDL
jgi:mRNA interferase RelE/StbE